jgi:Uma2 family endonuclease
MDIKEPAPKYYPKMTPEEFLVWERLQEYKHEYYHGHIVDMSGASLAHNFIQSNLFAAIGHHLENKPYHVFGSDLRIEVKAAESYFYPDISIVCGEPELSDTAMDMIRNPAVLIEILSPSTELHDIRRKKFFYMQLPSLQEYIMIDSTEIMVETIQRQQDGSWKTASLLLEKMNPSALLSIGVIGFSLPLTAVYRNTKLQ